MRRYNRHAVFATLLSGFVACWGIAGLFHVPEAQGRPTVSKNAAAIAENTADIAENAAGIAENADGIADNADDIADNADAILETRTALCVVFSLEGLPRPAFCPQGLDCPCWEGSTAFEILSALNGAAGSVAQPICVVEPNNALAGDNADGTPGINGGIAGGAGGTPQQGFCLVTGLSGISDQPITPISLEDARICINELSPIVSQVTWCP